MARIVQIICLVLVAKFSLNYWLMVPVAERQKLKLSYAIEFALKARGKACVYEVVSLEGWSVELHAEMLELGI